MTPAEIKALVERLEEAEPFINDPNRFAISKMTRDRIATALRSFMDGGWRIVPVEPTEEMINAYFDVCSRHGVRANITASTAWTSMLSALPTPPAVEGEAGA